MTEAQIPALDPAGAGSLYQAARALAGALTAAEVAAAVFEHVLADLGATSSGLWMVDAEGIRFAGGAGVFRDPELPVWLMPADSDLPAAVCIRENRPVFYGSAAERDRRWPVLASVRSTSDATAILPLRAGTQVIGCLHVGYPMMLAEADFDHLLLGRLAELCAAALDRARLYEREHQLAQTLQSLLLPPALPTFDSMEAEARYVTADAEAEAGGDFFDLVRLPSGRAGFVIGDVEGHDALAAATMGQLRSATRALAGQFREPAGVIDALRWSWDLLGFARMATAVIGRIDPANGAVSVASVGHPPPFLIDASGHASVLWLPNGPALGAPAGPAVQEELVLGPGETLFLYTDGLIEDRRRGIDVGLDSLRGFLEGRAGQSLSGLCEDAISARTAGIRSDDVAVLALRRLSRAVTEREGQGGAADGTESYIRKT